jgi:hypothetical protein
MGSSNYNMAETARKYTPFPFIAEIADSLSNAATTHHGIKVWSIQVAHRFTFCPARSKPPHASKLLHHATEEYEMPGVSFDVPAQTVYKRTRGTFVKLFDVRRHPPMRPEAFLDRFAMQPPEYGLQYFPYNKDLDNVCPWDQDTHHYLNTRSFIDSPENLVRLMKCDLHFDFPGFTRSLSYCKRPCSYFTCHCEQLFAPSYNLCLDGRGTTWWCVARQDSSKYHEFLIGRIKQHYHLDEGECRKLEERESRLLLALLWAKKIFIDPREVKAAGIEVFKIDQMPGEVVLLDGDIVHSGVCSDDFSINEAINFIPVRWLMDGLPRLDEWVQWMVDDYIGMDIAGGVEGVPQLNDIIFDVDVKARVAQHVPRGVTRLFLQTVKRSIIAWQFDKMGKEAGNGRQGKKRKRTHASNDGVEAQMSNEEQKDSGRGEKRGLPPLPQIDYSTLRDFQLAAAIVRIDRIVEHLGSKHVHDWYVAASPDTEGDM